MENVKLFRKVAYPPLISYDKLTKAEKEDLVKNIKYLDERLQSYHPDVQDNWSNIRRNLKQEGYVMF